MTDCFTGYFVDGAGSSILSAVKLVCKKANWIDDPYGPDYDDFNRFKVAGKTVEYNPIIKHGVTIEIPNVKFRIFCEIKFPSSSWYSTPSGCCYAIRDVWKGMTILLAEKNDLNGSKPCDVTRNDIIKFAKLSNYPARYWRYWETRRIPTEKLKIYIEK
uniref:Uncharacterized protein n=1 Tax=Pithovirus LCDPAC01 TaxID=2506600 RepID=A0A481YMH9_9VIRU|nr:MAG: hypothetical protein LCDPAC01_00390 [Pithovirus LCDPAC01]